ncbi:MAG: general secretion pathway protein GspC [Leptospiraceae bacterium]|nr:general secretion pathway protein GspC [Leptospiraceae bacterium]
MVMFRPPPKQMTKVESYDSTKPNSPPKPVEMYENMVEGNFIRSKKIQEDEKKDAANSERSAEAAALGEVDPEADEMLVTGTLSGHPSFARVTIRAKKDPEAEEYEAGEKVGGYKIVAIRQHSILVSRGKVKFPVEIEETFGEARKKVAEQLAKQQEENEPENLESSSTIKKVLSRVDVEEKLRKPEDLIKNARYAPNFVNGKMDGYKIHAVGPGHIFYQLGARSNDIVKRVNGTPIDSMEKGMEIWTSVKTAPKITIDIDRAGKIITYEFTIRN